MGVVFLARDIALHRLVAIKVLRLRVHVVGGASRALPPRSAHDGAAEPSEHRSGPHLRRNRATTTADAPLVYIVMKYVHGESLAERMRREHTLAGGRSAAHSARSRAGARLGASRRRRPPRSQGGEHSARARKRSRDAHRFRRRAAALARSGSRRRRRARSERRTTCRPSRPPVSSTSTIAAISTRSACSATTC